MTLPAADSGVSAVGPHAEPPSESWRFFAAGVTVIGGLVLALSVVQTASEQLPFLVWILIGGSVLARRFTVVPPRPLPVISPSSWISYAVAILFGPAPAVVSVAVAEFSTTIARRSRITLDAAFDALESSTALWIASQLFVVVASVTRSQLGRGGSEVWQFLPPVTMAAVYFAWHSVLLATARAFKNGRSVADVWGDEAITHALVSYGLLWLATCLGNFNPRAMVLVLSISMPLAALAFLGYRQFQRFKDSAERHARDLETLYHGAIEALAVAVDAKDQVTHGHIRRVQRHTLALARALGVDDARELKALEAASLLHDIGKLAVPDYVLNKPGMLTRSELLTMKQHAPKGATILEAIGFPYPVVPIVRGHHEQWNGRGYPDGLAGDRIPLGARILSVVDCFDALTSDRPYRRKLSDDAAIAILRERKEEFYDPAVVETFVSLIPELRNEDAQSDATHPLSAMEEALSDTAPEPIEGTRALKVDLITPDAVGKLLRLRVAELVPHTEFCLWVPDSAGSALWPIHVSAALQSAIKRTKVRAGEGLAGWVFVNRHTIINSPPDLDFQDAAGALGLSRCVSTPVFAFGTIAGVLTVYTCQSGGFSETEVRTVGAIAQEVGLEFARHDRTLEYDRSSLDEMPPLANVG